MQDPTPLRGDVDGDGRVTFEDFRILSANFGTGTHRSEGDLDGDGAVTFRDFLALSANFGQEREQIAIPDSVPTISPQSVDVLAATLTAFEDIDEDQDELADLIIGA